jgi:hypothetical protein
MTTVPHSYKVTGHFFSWACLVRGCEPCRAKFLEEHIDTLPDACRATPQHTKEDV